MIDTNRYEGHTPAPWDVREAGINRIMVYTDDEGFAYEEANRNLVADAPLLLAEVKRLREQYTELREALVGDSPNWTHEELIERALEMSEPAELEFGEWHTDMGEEE